MQDELSSVLRSTRHPRSRLPHQRAVAVELSGVSSLVRRRPACRNGSLAVTKRPAPLLWPTAAGVRHRNHLHMLITMASTNNLTDAHTTDRAGCLNEMLTHSCTFPTDRWLTKQNDTTSPDDFDMRLCAEMGNPVAGIIVYLNQSHLFNSRPYQVSSTLAFVPATIRSFQAPFPE